MNEKINLVELLKRTTQANKKIAEGQVELSKEDEFIGDNLDILAHEASMDYMAKLKQDLIKAVEESNETEIERIREDMKTQKEAIKKYTALARENVGNYIDSSTGVADMEKFKKELNAFMAETFVIWYGKADADKAKISMQATPLSEMNYEGLRTTDKSLYGQYTINKDTAGMNHKEKEPKVKILDMKEFVGKPRSEVAKAIVEKYGEQYHIPGLEYEKYLLENPDKVPAELKDGNWHYFMGSALRVQYGYSYVPCVRWGGSLLRRIAGWLDYEWCEDGRVVLLEK